MRLAVIILACSIIPVVAAQKESSSYDVCMNHSGGVTSEMRDCATAESTRLHKAIDATYRRKFTATPTAQRDALAKAQKNWEDFHKIDCDRLYTEDGTLSLTMGDSCGVDQEKDRISELESSQIDISKSWPPVSLGFQDCLRKKDTACIQTEFTRQDKVLNDVYRKALAAVTKADKEDDQPYSPKRKHVLVNAERAWISWRNAQCDYFDLSQGPIAGATCRMEMTRRRSAEIDYYLKYVAPQ